MDKYDFYWYYLWLAEKHPRDFCYVKEYCRSHWNREDQNRFMTYLIEGGFLPPYEKKD